VTKKDGRGASRPLRREVGGTFLSGERRGRLNWEEERMIVKTNGLVSCGPLLNGEKKGKTDASRKVPRDRKKKDYPGTHQKGEGLLRQT